MSEAENTCRICRGESTSLQPLIHPCKCKGSIRYTHEDCLFEWLNHAHKPLSKCDICNTPYRIKTIYDPDMPSRISVFIVLAECFSRVLVWARTSISVLLYFMGVVIGVPLVFKFAVRFENWIIDGKSPEENPTFLMGLLFDRLEFDSSLKGYARFAHLTKLLFYGTYINGLLLVVVTVIIFFALMVEVESVVRDEGLAKQFKQNVEANNRRYVLTNVENGLLVLSQNPQESWLNRQLLGLCFSMKKISEKPDVTDEMRVVANQIIDVTRIALAKDPIFKAFDCDRTSFFRILSDIGHESRLALEPQDPPGPHLEHQGLHGSNVDLQDLSLLHQTLDDDFFRSQGIDTQGDGPTNVNADTSVHAVVQTIMDLNPTNEPEHQAPAPLRQAAPVAGGPVPNINEQADQGANGWDMMIEGILLDFTSPIVILIFLYLSSFVLTFLFYFIPQALGCVVTTICAFMYAFTLFAIHNSQNLFPRVFQTISLLTTVFQSCYKSPSVKVVEKIAIATSVIKTQLLNPLFSPILHMFCPSPNPQLDSYERAIRVFLGYSIVGVVATHTIRQISMKLLHGTRLQVYKTLFEIRATLKVFIIFSIEVFFFAVFCGWQIDFCFAPLFLSSFLNHEDGNLTILLLTTSLFSRAQVFTVRIATYWLLGTLYMLFFSQFVTMIRGNMIRPGVLYFVRSPDDPNARLVHDVLMRPLKLQLSRIIWSTRFYTILITGGIGVVTWMFRWIVTLYPTVWLSLPLSLNSLRWADLPILIHSMHKAYSNAIFTEAWKIYWQKAIDISCNRLRLSHFILDIPIAQERGHILYRSWWAMFKGTASPNFSRPMTALEAKVAFQTNPLLDSCFVPDGEYTRAPANDMVSRSYVKELFVCVSKDDLLLPGGTKKTEIEDDGYYSDEDSDELATENEYRVVYCPPDFILRCYGFVVMLWGFGVILTLELVLYLVIHHYMLTFTFRAFCTLTNRAPTGSWYVLFVPMMSVYSLDLILKRNFFNGFINGDYHVGRDGLWAYIRTTYKSALGVLVLVISMAPLILWFIAWTSIVHYRCVQLPIYHVANLSNQSNLPGDFSLVILPHIICSFFTIVPMAQNLYRIPLFTPHRETYVYYRTHLGMHTWCSRYMTVVAASEILDQMVRCINIPSLEVYSNFAYPIVFLILATAIFIKRGFEAYDKVRNKVKHEIYAMGCKIENVDGP